MAKYKFRLEALRRLREVRRDRQRTLLADAFRAEQVLAENRTKLLAEQAAHRSMQRNAIADRHLDVNRLLEAQRYEIVLKAQEHELARQANMLAVETERRRQAVVEADREVRVLEMLDERQRKAYQQHRQRVEIRELDESVHARTPQSPTCNL